MIWMNRSEVLITMGRTVNNFENFEIVVCKYMLAITLEYKSNNKSIFELNHNSFFYCGSSVTLMKKCHSSCSSFCLRMVFHCVRYRNARSLVSEYKLRDAQTTLVRGLTQELREGWNDKCAHSHTHPHVLSNPL